MVEGAYGDAEALNIANIERRSTIVVASFDQAAAIDVIWIIVFADSNTSSPIRRVDCLEGSANSSITRVADGGWRTCIVAERGIETAAIVSAIIGNHILVSTLPSEGIGNTYCDWSCNIG